MKIQLLIAVRDLDYMEHLSQVLSEKYEDTFELSICSSVDHLEDMTRQRRFDVALLDAGLEHSVNLQSVKMPLLLWSDAAEYSQQTAGVKRIRKYQRISAMVSQILELYSEISDQGVGMDSERTHICVVWSPAGGSGKTTVALAYAAQQATKGKRTVYLNLEPFSSSPVYFQQSGKGLSSVFGKLDGNVEMLLQSIRQVDSASGIFYYCRPDNYDDIGVLNEDEIVMLAKACSHGVEELIVDLGSVFDQRIYALLDLAETVLLVTDTAQSSQIKLDQFRSQHNVYEKIQSKLTIVANRGLRNGAVAGETQISLPLVQSEDPIVVYRTLASGYFAQ